MRQAVGFGPPARRSHDGDDRDLIHDHRWILYEHGIRKFRFGRERNDPNPQFGQAILIRFVLGDGFGDVNWLVRMKGQLTIADACAHLASNCRQHFNQEWTLMNTNYRCSGGRVGLRFFLLPPSFLILNSCFA